MNPPVYSVQLLCNVTLDQPILPPLSHIIWELHLTQNNRRQKSTEKSKIGKTLSISIHFYEQTLWTKYTKCLCYTIEFQRIFFTEFHRANNRNSWWTGSLYQQRQYDKSNMCRKICTWTTSGNGMVPQPWGKQIAKLFIHFIVSQSFSHVI